MKELRDRVAVVTGAASGIGRALAHAFAAEGMHVVLADVEAGPLEQAAADVARRGVKTLAVRTDVSRGADVEALAQRTLDAFGAVHVVCNNAGVSISGLSWMHTVADWEWVLGVNLWGVIHGVRVFTPLLLGQGEGHVVNTASIAGMLSAPGMSVYDVAKHGVVTLSESLHHELAMLGSPVKVSVLCPAWVATRIIDADRNRPAALADRAAPFPGEAELKEAARGILAAGLAPERVAALVVDAVRAERFWVLPHPDWKRYVRIRMEDILEERSPSLAAVEALGNPGAPLK